VSQQQISLIDLAQQSIVSFQEAVPEASDTAKPVDIQGHLACFPQ